MGRKKAEEKEEGAYWMDTYGDMVTLLLTFFVLLFAMSSLDKDKWELFVKAFQSKFETQDQVVIMLDPDAEEVGNEDVKPTGEAPTVGNVTDPSEIENVEDVEKFEDLYLFMKKYLEDKGMTDSMRMEKGNGFVYISFDNSVFFEPDDYRLLPVTRELLTVICDLVSQIPDKIGEIHAHGHTAQESANRLNTISFDRRLSANRAAEVVIFIEENSNIPGARIKDTGHGQHTPLKAHDGTEETRRVNRRCELVIAEQGTAPPSLAEIYEMFNDPENFKDIEGLPPVISSPTKPPAPTDSGTTDATSDAATASGTTSDGAVSGDASGATSGDAGAASDGTASGTATGDASQPAENPTDSGGGVTSEAPAASE